MPIFPQMLTWCESVELSMFRVSMLKDDAVKGLHSNARKSGKLSSGHGSGKGEFSFQSQRKAMPKMFILLHNCTHLTQYQRVMLKILQDRLQQYVNHELPDVQAGFIKSRGTRDQIANIRWIIGWNDPKMEKQESSRKTSISALLTMLKPLTVWITTNGRKFLKRRVHQTT